MLIFSSGHLSFESVCMFSKLKAFPSLPTFFFLNVLHVISFNFFSREVYKHFSKIRPILSKLLNWCSMRKRDFWLRFLDNRVFVLLLSLIFVDLNFFLRLVIPLARFYLYNNSSKIDLQPQSNMWKSAKKWKIRNFFIVSKFCWTF